MHTCFDQHTKTKYQLMFDTIVSVLFSNESIRNDMCNSNDINYDLIKLLCTVMIKDMYCSLAYLLDNNLDNNTIKELYHKYSKVLW